jgi:hypothetical protein
MMIDFIRKIHAAQNFSIKDNFEFIEFDDITAEELQTEGAEAPETIEIWAAVKITYTGQVPDSYKVLNLMIGDWVENHVEPLTKVLHAELKTHFQSTYPDSDHTALNQMEDTAVWLDQLDYMPRIEVDKQEMVIEVELVLNAEPLGND